MPTGPPAEFSTGAGSQVSFPYKTPLSPYNTSAPVRSKGSLGKLGDLPKSHNQELAKSHRAVRGRGGCSPCKEEVQHLLGGGKVTVCVQKDVDTVDLV